MLSKFWLNLLPMKNISVILQSGSIAVVFILLQHFKITKNAARYLFSINPNRTQSKTIIQ